MTYMTYYDGSTVTTAKSAGAVSALVLGVFSLFVVAVFPLFAGLVVTVYAVPFAVAAIVTGHVALSSVHTSERHVQMNMASVLRTGSGMAVTGFVLGYLSLVILLATIIIFRTAP